MVYKEIWCLAIEEKEMKERIKDFIIKNLKWIILFICLIGFLALAEDVFNKEIMKGDIIGYKMVSTFLISDLYPSIYLSRLFLVNDITSSLVENN